ncbi:MAG: hypothetical protein ACUVTD_07315 [Nitrososphaerales archaeon]
MSSSLGASSLGSVTIGVMPNQSRELPSILSHRVLLVPVTKVRIRSY